MKPLFSDLYVQKELSMGASSILKKKKGPVKNRYI
jgi:hypothetical protein